MSTEKKQQQYALRVPKAIVDAVEKLMSESPLSSDLQHQALSNGSLSKAGVMRLAIAKGIEILQNEHAEELARIRAEGGEAI